MRATAVLAVGAFAARTNARARVTRIGLAAGVAVLVLERGVAFTAGHGGAFDPDIASLGFLAAALFGLRSGLEAQKATGLASYLRHNLVTPAEHAAGMVVSALLAWIALCAGAFGALLATTGGDLGTAAWHTGAWGLRSLLLVGFVPAVEAVAALGLPFILPVLAYLALAVTLSLAVGEETALAVFAPVERGDPSSLTGVAVQAGVIFPAASAAFVAASAAAARWSGGRRRLARVGSRGPLSGPWIRRRWSASSGRRSRGRPPPC